MPKELHEMLKTLATEKGMTLTTLINSVMADYAGISTSPGFINELTKRVETLEKEVFNKKK